MSQNDAVQDLIAAGMAWHRGILDRRREMAERPFGTIKREMYEKRS
jgi:hypothetical protein